MQRALSTKTKSLGAEKNAHEKDFLVFKLGKEEYGINILKIQEIRLYEKPVALTGSPNYIIGAIDLRGKIIPIVDMRVKFNMGRSQYDSKTMNIIVNSDNDAAIGLVVDSVSDVISFLQQEMKPIPKTEVGFAPEYLLAMGSKGERMVILLNIEKYLESVLRNI